jgi:small conductance mechanosensitive channel
MNLLFRIRGLLPRKGRAFCGIAAVAVTAVLFLAVTQGWGQTFLSEEKARAARRALLGAWTATIGNEEVHLRFEADSAYSSDGGSGTFEVQENAITFTPKEGEAVVYVLEFPDSATCTLSGGDLKQPLRFTRDLSAGQPLPTTLRKLLDISPHSAKQKAVRTVVILLIIFASIMLIRGMEWLSRCLIYSEAGPLRYIFQRHKSRTRTIHSVVLNVIKYFIIFSAFGQVFAQLGINYTTYIASLSVVGLAIGFGSQGLVQDVVTGLFLILDNQLDVGDMVEIVGQTGIVSELGLRTTRLQNYLGQTVVISNRNIATVGNYRWGSLKAVVDIAANDNDTAVKMTGRLEALCGELAQQFQGTILTAPKPPTVLALKTGEFFARVVLDLWPQQQSIMDSQVVPRMREWLKAAELEIARDRVAILYRLPATLTIPGHRFIGARS